MENDNFSDSDMFRYPSTKNLRAVLEKPSHLKRLGLISLGGTVKIHGTNTSVLATRDGTWSCQSRNRRITLNDDHFDFCHFLEKAGAETIRYMVDAIYRVVPTTTKQIVVFGEYAGEGIQQCVALSTVPRFWSIFGVQVMDESGRESWLPLDTFKHVHANDHRIYNVTQFATFQKEIDFSWSIDRVEAAVNEMKELVKQVEECCPVGRFFGVNGIGEGIVWSNSNRSIMFKMKGLKHRESLEWLLKEYPKSPAEKMAKSLAHDGRLQQGIEYLVEMKYQLTSDNVNIFIKWVQGDIDKEENDIINASEFASGDGLKQLNEAIIKRTSNWYHEFLKHNGEIDVKKLILGKEAALIELLTDDLMRQGLEHMTSMNIEHTISNIGIFMKHIQTCVTQKQKDLEIDGDATKAIGPRVATWYKKHLAGS